MMSLIFGLYTQVSGSGLLGPLVVFINLFICLFFVKFSYRCDSRRLKVSSAPIFVWRLKG